MKRLLEKYRELIAYGVCGVLTTSINIVTYQILAHPLGIHYLASNALAWILAFLFAYWSNSRWVFGYPAFGENGCMGRFLKFLGGRAFTGILDMVLMWLLVDILSMPDSWSKVGVDVLVIALNYLMSKLLIFKEGKE